MRIRGAIGGLASAFVAIACGDDAAGKPVDCPDAAAVDAGPIDAGPPAPRRAHVNSPELRTLLAGGDLRLLGVTTNFEPYVVFYRFNADNSTDLGVVPVYGGAPVILQKAIAEADNAFVSGGAVAWYAGTAASGIASAISIWTPENGTKKVTTKTAAGIFAATRDGTRVAFSAGADIDETPLVVTSSAALAIDTPSLAGASSLNLAASATQCLTTLEFHARTLFGTFCTGHAVDDQNAKLYTVDEAGLAVERANESAASLGNGNIVFFNADAVGHRAFVFTGDARAHLVTLNGADTVVRDLGDANDARVLDDGSGVVVLRGKALSRVAEDEVLLANDATILYGLTRDSKTVFFATTDPQASATDLKAIPATGGAAVSLVASPTSRFIDASGSSSHAIYRTNVVDGVGALKATPVLGGVEATLASITFGANVAPEGTGLLSVTNASTVSGTAAFRATFAYSDAALVAPPVELATALLTFDTGTWIDRSFVYQDEGTAPGIFALEVP